MALSVFGAVVVGLVLIVLAFAAIRQAVALVFTLLIIGVIVAIVLGFAG